MSSTVLCAWLTSVGDEGERKLVQIRYRSDEEAAEWATDKKQMESGIVETRMGVYGKLTSPYSKASVTRAQLITLAHRPQVTDLVSTDYKRRLGPC